jgi:apolipoprotein N-acyltransferase
MTINNWQNKKALPWLLSVSSGILLWIGWPTSPVPYFLFIGLVPLLILQDYLQKNSSKSGRKVFGFGYLAFFIWNVATTWWVWNSTPAGAIAMLVLNTLFMAITFWLFHLTRKAAGDLFGYLGLVCYWLAFEYIHLNWDISWPWLNLGNGFAMIPELIQWYEFTGAFGGALWIWLLNLALFFSLFYKGTIKKPEMRWLTFAIALLVVPSIGSYLIGASHEESQESVEVVVTQPNIDPYSEKFIGSEKFIPYQQQVEKFINLSQQELTTETSFLVWPETAIDNVFNEVSLDRYPILDTIAELENQFSALSVLTGITSYQQYLNVDKATPTARYRDDLGYYDVFNAALFMNENGIKKTYHKSKLVPGVEILPYPKVLNFLTEWIFDLGGTTGSLGRQKERTVFYNENGVGIAPAICYESIYGEFMAEFIRNGAHYIFIITNDGWWGNTPGHRQHLHYATTRAIETRRSIARSANTGISAFIDQTGNISHATEYWEPAVIRADLNKNEELTFYVVYGDYLARTSLWLSIFILLASIVKKRMKR